MRPTRVQLGSNVFTDCGSPLGLGDRPLVDFDVQEGRLLVTLDAPSPPAKVAVRVVANRAEDRETTVTASDGDVTLARNGKVLLRARLVSPDVVAVESMDLRPLGLAIVASASGLRLGNALLANNAFARCRLGVRVDA